MQKQIYLHFAEAKVSKTKSKYEKAGANTTGIRFYPGEVKDSERREKTGTCSLFSEVASYLRLCQR